MFIEKSIIQINRKKFITTIINETKDLFWFAAFVKHECTANKCEEKRARVLGRKWIWRRNNAADKTDP